MLKNTLTSIPFINSDTCKLLSSKTPVPMLRRNKQLVTKYNYVNVTWNCSISNKPSDDCVLSYWRESWKLNPGYCSEGWVDGDTAGPPSDDIWGRNFELKTGIPNKGEAACLSMCRCLKNFSISNSHLTWATKHTSRRLVHPKLRYSYTIVIVQNGYKWNDNKRVISNEICLLA